MAKPKTGATPTKFPSIPNVPVDWNLGKMAEFYEELLGTEVNLGGGIPYHEAIKLPVLEVGIDRQLDKTELEEKLEGATISQHLDHIFQQPRRMLKSHEEVLAAPRVKRVSSRAILDLTSRSERWRRRTLRGIEPREVLAIVHDDIVDRYENRLAADFADRVIRVLTQRLERLRSTDDLFELMERFQQSADDGSKVWYKLRERLYRLWGESADGVVEARGRIREIRTALEVLRERFISYRSLPLYTGVPVNHQVADAIHETNILINDQHYRHLPNLWRLLLLGRRTRSRRIVLSEDEKGVYDSRLFERFIYGVVAHALKSLGFNTRSSSAECHDWCLARRDSPFQISVEFKGEGKLYMSGIPSGGRLILRSIPLSGLSVDSVKRAAFIDWMDQQKPDKGDRYVFLVSGGNMDGDDLFFHRTEHDSSSAISVSPLDLWSVERIGRIIRRWLDAARLSNFPLELNGINKNYEGSIPSNAKVSWDKSRKAYLVWDRLPPVGEWKNRSPARKHENSKLPTLQKAVEDANRAINDLLICPVCGKAGGFKELPDRDHHTYIAQCPDRRGCGAQWGVAGKDQQPFLCGGDDRLQTMSEVGLDGIG